MWTATQILTKILYLYIGALVPLTLAKLNICTIDLQTNIVIHYLLVILIGAITLFFSLLGW